MSINFSRGATVNLPGDSAILDNAPTLRVLRQPSSPVDISAYWAVASIGAFSIVIDTSTLSASSNAKVFAALGGVGCTLSLSNGGTIGGATSYVLKAGQITTFQFDGTNFV